MLGSLKRNEVETLLNVGQKRTEIARQKEISYLNSAPTFFIHGRRHDGRLDYETFVPAMRNRLAGAETLLSHKGTGLSVAPRGEEIDTYGHQEES